MASWKLRSLAAEGVVEAVGEAGAEGRLCIGSLSGASCVGCEGSSSDNLESSNAIVAEWLAVGRILTPDLLTGLVDGSFVSLRDPPLELDNPEGDSVRSKGVMLKPSLLRPRL
jgi:hypothetical protein